MNIRKIDFNDAILGLLIIGIAILISFHSFARDNSNYAGVAPNIRNWYQSLMQPDNPSISCCGEADAFEADEYEVQGNSYVAIITDGKGTIPNGTRILVPNKKIKWDKGNPTGHGIIFLGSGQASPRLNDWPVYCYVIPAGI